MRSNASIKKILVPLAIIFALLTVIAGNPHKISFQPISVNEEFDLDGKLVNVIDVQELAKWIMDKKADYYLIDIRLKNRFDEYHIPYALSLSGQEMQNISMNKKATIIIYDTSGRYSFRKIRPIINNRKGTTYLLQGGMREWINEVLFPDLREHSSLSEAEIDKIYKTSTYFGGKPVLDKERPKRKYKREGC